MELIRITCPSRFPADALDDMAAILDEAGVAAELIEAPSRMGASIDPTAILIAAPATAYLTTLAARMGQGTPTALTRLVKYLRQRLPAGGPPVTVEVGHRCEGENGRMLFVYTVAIQNPERAQERADQLIQGKAHSGIYQWDAVNDDWSLS